MNRLIAAFAGLAVMAAGTALAAPLDVKSAVNKLELTADGGAGWCKPALRLHLAVAPDSPIAGNLPAIEESLHRFLVGLAGYCPAAVAAVIDVNENGQKIATLGGATATGWIVATGEEMQQKKQQIAEANGQTGPGDLIVRPGTIVPPPPLTMPAAPLQVPPPATQPVAPPPPPQAIAPQAAPQRPEVANGFNAGWKVRTFIGDNSEDILGTAIFPATSRMDAWGFRDLYGRQNSKVTEEFHGAIRIRQPGRHVFKVTFLMPETEWRCHSDMQVEGITVFGDILFLGGSNQSGIGSMNLPQAGIYRVGLRLSCWLPDNISAGHPIFALSIKTPDRDNFRPLRDGEIMFVKG